jgi:hypothetical protein
VNINDNFVALAAITCYFVLGACLSYYPQNTKIDAKELEPYFQNIKDAYSQPILFFEFNKGL